MCQDWFGFNGVTHRVYICVYYDFPAGEIVDKQLALSQQEGPEVSALRDFFPQSVQLLHFPLTSQKHACFGCMSRVLSPFLTPPLGHSLVSTLWLSVVAEKDSAAAQQYSRQGCPTGLRADLWALILNATNQPQVPYTHAHTHRVDTYSCKAAVHTQLRWFPDCTFRGGWTFHL